MITCKQALHFGECREKQTRETWCQSGVGGLLSGIVALVASFAPEQSEGANDATRNTNKLQLNLL